MHIKIIWKYSIEICAVGLNKQPESSKPCIPNFSPEFIFIFWHIWLKVNQQNCPVHFMFRWVVKIYLFKIK